MVVAQVRDDELLVAESRESFKDGFSFARVGFHGLPDTWRTKSAERDAVSRGRLMDYLNPLQSELSRLDEPAPVRPGRSVRVMDRKDLQGLLPLGGADD